MHFIVCLLQETFPLFSICCRLSQTSGSNSRYSWTQLHSFLLKQTLLMQYAIYHWGYLLFASNVDSFSLCHHGYRISITNHVAIEAQEGQVMVNVIRTTKLFYLSIEVHLPPEEVRIEGLTQLCSSKFWSMSIICVKTREMHSSQ